MVFDEWLGILISGNVISRYFTKEKVLKIQESAFSGRRIPEY
jgi:hypothetical protein